MKPSGVEWLGDIPEDWDVRPVISIADVLVSTVDKKEHDGEKSVRLCNYTDVYYQDVIGDDPGFMVATASDEQIERFTPRVGDVPFTKDSETSDDIGVPAYVSADLPGVVYGYHLGIYRPHDVRYGRFLKYLLESSYVKTSFETRTPGVTRVGLSRNTMRYLRVPTPPVTLALAIADFLDRETAQIDAFIAKSEQLIALLAERRTAVPEKVLADRVARGDRLKWAFNEIDVRAGDTWQDLPLLSVSIAWGVKRRDEVTSDEPSAGDMSGYKVCESGDIVVNRMRAFQGALGVAPQRGIVSPDYAVLRLRDAVPVYVAHLMKTERFVGEMVARLKGIGSTESGTVRTPRINVADLGDIRADLPSGEQQATGLEEINTATVKIDAAITTARRSIDLARERRAALISAAVTGQLDVVA